MKRISLILALLTSIAVFASAQQLVTTDTLGTNVTAYADGQRIAGPTTSYIVLKVKLPNMAGKTQPIKSGWLTTTQFFFDSSSVGSFQIHALKDTVKLMQALTADHAAIQSRDAMLSLTNYIGSSPIFSTEVRGTSAGGATKTFAQFTWLQDFEMTDGKQWIFFIVEARSAVTPKKNGAIEIRTFVKEKK